MVSHRSWYQIVVYYKGSAWVPAGTHAPDRKQYLSAESRVIMFKQTHMRTPFDLVANRIRAMPSSAGKRQCRVSVLSFCISLTRFIDQHFLYHLFGTLLFLSFSAIYSEAQTSEPSIIMGKEMIDNLELSCCWRGQKSAQFGEVSVILPELR